MAYERDIKVSDKEVDRTLKELAAQNGLESVDAFVAAMEQQGMDRDEVESQMQTQVKAEKESEVAQRLITDLREKADVVVNV